MNGDEEHRDPAARLDALWEATRPADPTNQAWGHVWATVSAELDRREGEILNQPKSGFGRRPLAVAAAAATIALAQAAAVLLAFGLAWPGTDRSPEPATPVQVAAAEIRIDEGRFVLIRTDAETVRAVDLSSHLGADGVDAWYIAYNLLEAMTSPVVAMSE